MAVELRDAKVAEAGGLAVWGDGRFGGEGLTSANKMYDAGWAMWYCQELQQRYRETEEPDARGDYCDEVINTPGFGSTPASRRSSATRNRAS